MTATMISPENAPRDFAGLMALTRAIRFRLALNIGLVTPSSSEAQAFVGAAPETQSKSLQEGLATWDANNGGAPAAAPQTAPAPLQPQGTVVPQQMAPPAMGAAGMAPPPAMGAVPAPMTRTPATPADPTNAGARPGAAPAVAAVAGNVEVLKALADLDKKVKEIRTELDGCAGVAEIEEVMEAIKGLAHITKMNTIFLLEIAENLLGLDKVTLGSMAAAISAGGEVEAIIGKAATEGKG